MAYLSLVEYDQGGTIRSLDGFAPLTAGGLAAVEYDDGRSRNLLGSNLGAVKYDDGGRFRTLVGLGQDLPPDMPPPDVGIDQSIAPAFPIDYTPPSIAPTFIPYVPSPVVDLTSAPITGSLTPPPTPTPPASAGTLVSVVGASAGALTSIFSGIKNVFSGTTTSTKPVVAGTVAPTGTVGASWFSQPSALGVPNWGMLAGVGIAGVLLMAVMRSGGSASPRRRNPGRRRKNPAELILMGANPRGRWVH